MEENSIKQKKQLLNYINVFRALAILLILAGHTLQIGFHGTLLRKITLEVFAGGTALFIFISGFLFQHLSYKFEYKNYMMKKWKNVIVPYIITAIPGIILCFTIPQIYKNPFDGLNYFAQIGIFLTTGRVHNVPTWFIPMIVIFFILSYLLLYLEKKNILYKFLPILLAVTVLIPRGDIEPDWLNDLDYLHKYFAYLQYILTGFIHFASMYVLGMYLSKYKEKIDILYDKRWILIFLMLLTTIADIYFYNINVTISKIFLTLIVLGYLKHYDEQIKSFEKINNALDVIAKYSFGLFFIHWYYNFAFTRLFNVSKIISIDTLSDVFIAMGIASLRYLFVFTLSFLTLFLMKKGLQLLKIENTRMFTGV